MSLLHAYKLSGFIASLHLAEIPLKNPEKKYEKDERIECRVLICINKIVLAYSI